MKTVFCKSHILRHEVRTQAINKHCLFNFSHVATFFYKIMYIDSAITISKLYLNNKNVKAMQNKNFVHGAN